MRVGIGCLPTDFGEYRDWVCAAEASGFDRLGTGDSTTLWADPFVALGFAATHTTTIELTVTGTNPVTRHPVAAAGAIETVQILSGGRCSYALGSGDSSVANIGHDRASLGEVEEYARAVRDLCAGRETTYHGCDLSMRWASQPVPVLLCAEGPRTQELAGNFADGAVLYNGITEEVVTSSLAAITRGADEAGRTIADMDLWWPIVLHVGDDIQQGIDAVKFSLAGTANRAFRHSLHDKMVPEELHAGFRNLQARYRSSHHQQLGAHHHNAALVDEFGLTEYLASRFAIVGPPALCVDRLAELASYGVRNVMLSILSQTLPQQVETMRVIAEEILPFTR
jgi:5,10-methylenetetrahydromethanopterin reductase